MKHMSDVVAFVLGLILPSRFLWLALARFIASVLGRRALENYLDEHFPKKRRDDAVTSSIYGK